MLKTIYDYLVANFNFSSFGVSLSYEEMQLKAPACTILGKGGGATRDLYIGGGKEIDFIFTIMLKLNSEDTAGRMLANDFFESLTVFIENAKISLGTNRYEVKCVLTSMPNKSTVNSNNSQEWQADYTLTYREV